MAQPKRLSAEKVAQRILARAKAQKAAQAQKEHQEFVEEFEAWKAQQTSTPIFVDYEVVENATLPQFPGLQVSGVLKAIVKKDTVQLINDFYAQIEVTKAFNDALREIKEKQVQTSEDIFPLYLRTGPVGLRSYVAEEF